TWYYAGPVMLTLVGEHFLLRYPPSLAPLARELLAQLEQRVQEGIGDASRTSGAFLGLLLPPGKKLTVWLYDDPATFRLTTAPTLPAWAKTWVGFPAKYLVKEGGKADPAEEAPFVLGAAINQSLLTTGIETPWLRYGLAAYSADLLFPDHARRYALRRFDELLKAARYKQIPSLSDLDFHPADRKAAFRARSFAWDAVHYLIESFGWDRLTFFLERFTQGDGEEAFHRAFGLTQQEFDAQWRASLAYAHIPPEFTRIARSFDTSRTMEHIRTLASPEFAGREAGTEGGRKAAAYIAELLTRYHLEPAGDDGSYFQEFPISCTHLLTTPQFIVAGVPYTYGVDFRELSAPVGDAGVAEGQLVWVRDGSFSDMDLTGKIAVRFSRGEPEDEIRKAAEHKAIGLILIRDASREKFRTRHPLVAQDSAIPTVQITSKAFERMITPVGYTLAELNNSPPALPLELYGRIVVSTAPWGACTAHNILALLPGSDPTLADQILILSAHYDHVGTAPDGVLFPGANDDASGVATLLEIARLWSEGNFHPRRSVLFAFWDAEERGSEGSGYFTANPTVPITDVVGVLHLDNVAQGGGYYLIAEGERAVEGNLMAWLKAAAQEISGRLDIAQPEQAGDHTLFRGKGIPATLVHWEDSDDDANTPADTPDSLDERKLRTSGQIIALAAMMLSWR
ncbi:MAG: hypothetical protein DRI61_07090, partial [Chloroflexi bacterium]